ncbi:head-tail connector protein [Roseospira visakhapatnamensis]|uniref:Putative phiE125 gp8 family phage protein n=1 Tax=Roseospira visakhapatnamensis TaxID=390880 RepID=A0A7W6RAA3_9PROT|nr:phage gp6-like head-tail connector protein [Roseospira visakhapatnamensis]MBB4264803.1 putative phiE125 gp8 family phage protein [Roseospira visakhapatnamensis]
MSLIRVTAPAVLPVTERSVWDFLRLSLGGEVPPDSADVRTLIEAAADTLDGAEGWLGRALVTQTWVLRLDEFPHSNIDLPLPPLRTVDSVAYLDTSGTETTLSADRYHATGVGDFGRLVPVTSWPATARRPEAVRITFTCGYGDGPDAVPEPIKVTLRQMVALTYDTRTPMNIGNIVNRLPDMGLDALARFKVWSF